MEEHKLGKDLIFFVPGQSGVAFTYKAGYLINDDLITQARDQLEYEMGNTIDWVMERRATPRPV